MTDLRVEVAKRMTAVWWILFPAGVVYGLVLLALAASTELWQIILVTLFITWIKTREKEGIQEMSDIVSKYPINALLRWYLVLSAPFVVFTSCIAVIKNLIPSYYPLMYYEMGIYFFLYLMLVLYEDEQDKH